MFFCFKQKTAYEMRISDWSSDVCSSDRGPGDRRLPFQRVDAFGAQQEFGVALQEGPPDQLDIGRQRRRGLVRSEEHTSELQSLMRSSYAVFCLKKKKIYQKSKDRHR